jgi:hypothetical protein
MFDVANLLPTEASACTILGRALVGERPGRECDREPMPTISRSIERICRNYAAPILMPSTATTTSPTSMLNSFWTALANVFRRGFFNGH